MAPPSREFIPQIIDPNVKDRCTHKQDHDNANELNDFDLQFIKMKLDHSKRTEEGRFTPCDFHPFFAFLLCV